MKFILVLLFLPTLPVFAISVTDIEFKAPEGFTPLSKEAIAKKWPSERAPGFAVGNTSNSTTIAYDVKPVRLPQDKLEELQVEFSKHFQDLIPDLEWKKNKIITLCGQRWLLLEMTSKDIKTDIYNILLMTGVDDELIAFNFNSTKEDFPKYEASLRKSIETINFKHLKNPAITQPSTDIAEAYYKSVISRVSEFIESTLIFLGSEWTTNIPIGTYATLRIWVSPDGKIKGMEGEAPNNPEGKRFSETLAAIIRTAKFPVLPKQIVDNSSDGRVLALTFTLTEIDGAIAIKVEPGHKKQKH
jgi:hypothetical protein